MRQALRGGRSPLLIIAAATLIVQMVLAWTYNGAGALERLDQFYRTAFIAGSLGRPIPDAYDSFISWTNRNTGADSVILLVQTAGSVDAFRYFRASELAYPRTIWWGTPDGPGPYPDWHVVIPTNVAARAELLSRFGIDYLLLDGVPLSQWSMHSPGYVRCFNQQLKECLVDVRSVRA